MSPAKIHTEAYRAFQGELLDRRPRFFPLYRSGMRIALVKKIPLVMLYGPVVIITLFACFSVYGIFAFQEETPADLNMGAVIAAGLASQLLNVKGILSVAYGQLSIFALLSAAWYGAGLIADDKRQNAHLFYFSRPFGRLDYLLGKFWIAFTFAALASVIPGIAVCLVAIFVSPEWSFLKNESQTILLAISYSVAWSAAMSLLVLAASSLVSRKALALIGFLGLILAGTALASVLSFTLQDGHWYIGSITGAFSIVRRELFSDGLMHFGPPREGVYQIDPADFYPAALLSISLWMCGAALLLWLRVRRMEVIS